MSVLPQTIKDNFKMSKHNAKFSHRLFNQYFVSAIIPVMILAAISFYTVTGLLKKNAERQIYAESRAVGLTLFDRLLSIESNLLNIGKSTMNDEFSGNNEWAWKMFSSLYISNENSDREILFGEPATEYVLNNEQHRHLRKGKRVLLVADSGKNTLHLLMLHALNADAHKILVAELVPDYLWDITTKEDDLFCVAVNKNTLLYCPESIDKTSNKEKLIKYLVSSKQTGLQEIMFSNEPYLGNVWELFLEPNFSLEGMSVVYFILKKNAFLEYEYYKDALPLSISITLLLVFIFSSVQMRRSLLPLNSLINGSKDIIAGNYKQRVEVNSNDEFETLANTFNDMSSRIDEQFRKIKALTKIDHLILSTSDTDYIVEVLMCL